MKILISGIKTGHYRYLHTSICSGIDFGINGAIFDIIYRAKTASSVRNYSKHDFSLVILRLMT